MRRNPWTDRLMAWYDQHQRDLPWRHSDDPYAKWLSEIMLQQTQVKTVIPYYKRFIEEVPDIESLAALDERRLHKLWEGLGYYRRAGYLHKAAQILVRDYDGKLPEEYDELIRLPGIGPYTAAAISAMAFQKPYVAMDGNLERVFARFLAERRAVDQGPVKKRLKATAEDFLDHERPGDYNQALMDLGSGICLANGEPLCELCPWQEACEGYLSGLQVLIPQKSPKKPRRQEARTLFLHAYADQLLLRRRPNEGLLAGLWEFPNISRRHEKLRPSWESAFASPPIDLGRHQHIYSHIVWQMRAYLFIHPRQPAHFQGHWVSLDAIADHYPLPAAFQLYFQRALAYLPS